MYKDNLFKGCDFISEETKKMIGYESPYFYIAASRIAEASVQLVKAAEKEGKRNENAEYVRDFISNLLNGDPQTVSDRIHVPGHPPKDYIYFYPDNVGSRNQMGTIISFVNDIDVDAETKLHLISAYMNMNN